MITSNLMYFIKQLVSQINFETAFNFFNNYISIILIYRELPK